MHSVNLIHITIISLFILPSYLIVHTLCKPYLIQSVVNLTTSVVNLINIYLIQSVLNLTGSVVTAPLYLLTLLALQAAQH